MVDPDNKYRFRRRDKDGNRYRSPIIPFYWGYSVPPEKRLVVLGTGIECHPDGSMGALCDEHGNPLRKDGTWGGGPFQNGTGSLLPFWQEGGFKKKILHDIVSLDWLNPFLGRHLFDCPDRRHYAHAARRLAHLVKTIRGDLPNEPINIVAHSQGTMVALCALFYLDKDGVRGPDTVILNSSPYHFDTKVTDFLTAAGGARDVQSEEARVNTFAKAAEIMQKAKDKFSYVPAPKAECTHQPVHRHKYDDKIFVHQPSDNPKWKAEIGAGDIGKDNLKWWSIPLHDRDNRGKLFVNFNPSDRVIGVSAVEGIGWRGIPPRYFGKLGNNVMQRMFARGSKEQPFVVGDRTGYRQAYFYTQMDRKPVVSGENFDGPAWTTSDGVALQTANENWHYLDGGSPNRQWFIPSEKILKLLSAHGDVSPRGDGGQSEYVTINAPLVPVPAELGPDFDLPAVRYDGEAGVDADGKPVAANQEQKEDFKEDVEFMERREITVVDNNGFKYKRFETWEVVEQRRRDAVGQRVVSPTNHAQILRYSGDNGFPVERVLSYDITVGQGYAWGDERYWNYLLDLADWKNSDPYYFSGELTEKIGDVPPGIDKTTSAMADDPRPSPAGLGQPEGTR
ncbi:DUF3274 domain-containing protein [Variovorax humicola]|uniref:DUF3274 domain-containing protein n=1 Tax=Variovorax humicola TaxID=1769758 RepID=A0ABU8W4G2_9BURK